MIRFLSITLGVLLLLAFGYCVIAQENKIGDFHLRDGRTIKGNFDDNLLILKSDSDEKGASYWIVPSNALTSITRASVDQPKPDQPPRFILKNEPSRLIFAKISSAMLQKPGAESAILIKLRADYDNPPPAEGVYLSFVTIDDYLLKEMLVRRGSITHHIPLEEAQHLDRKRRVAAKHFARISNEQDDPEMHAQNYQQ